MKTVDTNKMGSNRKYCIQEVEPIGDKKHTLRVIRKTRAKKVKHT